MRQRTHCSRAYALVPFILALSFLAGLAVAREPLHRPITRELIQLIEKDPPIGELLEASIASAKAVNPDPATNPVQSLAAYYNYVDSESQLIPGHSIDNPSGLTQERVLQNLCYFYFLVDQPLDALANRGLFRPNLQYYPPFSAWLRSFADRPAASWSSIRANTDWWR